MDKQTKGAITLAYLRGEKEVEVKAEQLLSIFRKRNSLIKKLHAYYKYSVEELAVAFRMSRTGIYYILNNRNEYGDYKHCVVCKTMMWQGNLDYHIWERKRYCCDYCKDTKKGKEYCH